MRDDELLKARHKEVVERVGHEVTIGSLLCFEHLVKTNWRPVDPDLIKARELASKFWGSDYALREGYLIGEYDNATSIQQFLEAIKYGRDSALCTTPSKGI